MKELRPYQESAHVACINALNRGINRQLVVIATGGGKTFLTVKLIEKLQYKRGLWITDREELITQSAIAFIRDKFGDEIANPIEKQGFVDFMRAGGRLPGDFKMGLIKADQFQKQGNVVMASAQTLHKRLDKLDPDEFDYVICDEAHLFAAKSMVASVNHFNPRLLLGLTATPFRLDGLPLGDIFDEQVYEYCMREGIRDGYLCEMDAVRIKTSTNLDDVHTLGGEFNQKELANEVNTLARNNLVADSYIKYANGRQGIFFGVDITHCLDLEEAFKAKGVNAKAVSSDEDRTGDRSNQVKAYKAGKIDVLINVGILTTGFDHPDTGVIGCAAPTKSKTRYIQSVGRGSRLKSAEYVAKFGQNCIVLDFVDSTRKHNLINAHELDKELPLEERVFITDEKRRQIAESHKQRAAAKITHTQEKDEIIKLFPVPKVKISKSIRMREEATPAQLAILAKLGHDVENNHYTKKMVSEIFNMQQISDAQYNFFKLKGYDVGNKIINKAQAFIMSKEIEAREKKRKW